MLKRKPFLPLLGLEALAIACYIWHQFVSAFIGWERSWYTLHILLFLALSALVATGLLKLLNFLATNSALRSNVPASAVFRSLVLSLSPLLFLFLIFLPYFVFLMDIRGYLLPLSLFGTSYLMVIFFVRLKIAYPAKKTDIESTFPMNADKISSPSLRALFFLSLFVYITLASGLVFPPQPFTGDEPHYLLITHSILKDGDINLYNNYRDKDYIEFYPGELEPHAYVGKKGDRFQYSKHFPALPVLLVPAYILGERVSRSIGESPNQIEHKRRALIFFSRLPLCFLTAWLGILFLLLVFDVTQKKGVSLIAWVLFSFTIPVLFYSHLLYPEIMAAILTIFTIRGMIIKKPVKAGRLVLSGVSIALLPWFGVKYLVLAAVLFGVSVIVLADTAKTSKILRKSLIFLSPILASAGCYILFFWVLYGNFSLASAYTGVSASPLPLNNISSPEPLVQIVSEMMRRFLGYFIDQKFGLFVYAPIFMLGMAGFYSLYKKKRREALLIMIVLGVYVLFSAGFYWGGFCPPPRPLIPVLPIWGLFLAAALAEKPSPFRSITITLCASLSFLVVWAALRNPWILYPERHANLLGGEILFARLWRNLSSFFVPVHTWLPSLTWEGTLSWLPIIFWLAAMVLVTWLFILKTADRKSQPVSFNLIGSTCMVWVLSTLVLLYAFFDIQLDDKVVFPAEKYELYFQDTNHFGEEVGGFWTRGSLPATIVLKSAQPLSAIQLLLTSSVAGEATVQVGMSQKLVRRTIKAGLSRETAFNSVKGFFMQKGYFYTITIKDSTGFVPFRLDENIRDNRNLGVFVQIKTR